MLIEATAVFLEVPEGYVGSVEELPGANVQEPTLAEARESLREAMELMIATNRELALADIGSARVIREALRIEAA